ncbi:MAG: transporter substrate-binding domain-containing protein [Neisseriaceae bacterium]|nr:transporter substrate-binding domain-containing protein [Neisseriaceae bacterium]
MALSLSACQPESPKAAQATVSEAASTSTKQDLLDTVQARGVLKVGLEGTYPPFNFKGKNQKLEGFEVELADEIGKRMGVKVEFTQGEWGGLLASLQTGKVDILINQVGINDKRKETFDFSVPYTYSSAQLIVKKGNESKFKSLDEMKGTTLAVTQGSNFASMLQAYPDIKLKLYPSMNDYLQEVSLGRVDGALNDSLVILTSIKKSGLPLSGGAIIGSTLSSGIPFNKGNPKFKVAIDKILIEMFNDGSFAGISKKWLGVDVSSQPSEQQ